MSVFSVLERLGPLIMTEVKQVINCKQEAESLSEKLNKVQVGLQEAERKGVTDKNAQGWLKDLEQVAYLMDDVLDEWERSNLQVEVQDTSFDWVKVRPLLDSLCSCINQLRSRCKISRKMKALSVRIDTILAEKDKFNLGSGDNINRAQEFNQEETTCHISKEFKAYGLEDVKNKFLQKLGLKGEGEGEGSGKDTQVISIVGAGGVGKTTLALVAYNDPEVAGLFPTKGWVCVSQLVNAKDIARAILGAFGGKLDGDPSLSILITSIKDVISEKKFLLVLDNVWVDDRNKWEQIVKCFYGKKGSRIVVTTRLETIARIMGTDQLQFLGLLSDQDCGTILNEVALEGPHGRSREECEKLRAIGMEIAKKCEGLPLAANSVGRMLALGSFEEQEWRDVLESPLWMEGEEKSYLYRLLDLSYTGLNPQLKRCFLSSVLFPKGTEISSDEIIRLWMAYGCLNSKSSISEVQSKGLRFLNDLVMRSFMQNFASMHERKSYKMHDTMHNFGSYIYVGNGYNFIRDGGLKDKDYNSPSHKTLPLRSLGKLRTFSVCREELRRDKIVSHLTSVRVLSMRECNLEELPKDIGKLFHLRYLNVSDNPITELPETITNLCHLQTLDIQRCESLLSLPEGIKKLINLRHLVNSGTSKLVKFPQGLETLEGLWTLSEFRGRNLGCLRNLNKIQGSMLLDLENLNEGEVGEPELWKKLSIKNLELVLDRQERIDVVEALKPPPNLQTLVIRGGCGLWLSHWIPTSFANLKKVHFFSCSYVPPFHKLPALEELDIVRCNFRSLSIMFLGHASSGQFVCGFSKLKKLRFAYCVDWKEWKDTKEKPTYKLWESLEELEISHCQFLQSLPLNLLGKATSLRVVKVSDKSSLYERYNNISGCDRDKIPLRQSQTWIVHQIDPSDEVHSISR